MEVIVAAIIAGVFGLASIIVQARVHRDNRADHADTARKVDAVLEAQGVMAVDVGDIKSDMREVRADLRDHGARLRAVEAPAKPASKPRKRTAQ